MVQLMIFLWDTGGALAILVPTLIELIGIERIGSGYGMALAGGAIGIVLGPVLQGKPTQRWQNKHTTKYPYFLYLQWSLNIIWCYTSGF